MGAGDAEVGEELSSGLRDHRRAAVSMDGELARRDVLLLAGFPDEPLSQACALVGRHHPADDVAAEDVEDHVQMEVGPLDRALEFRDVPGPDLVGCGGEELGLLIVGVSQNVASFADLMIGGEDAVHRPRGAHVDARVEQRGMDLGRGLISERFGIEGDEYLLALLHGQRSRWSRSRWRRSRRPSLPVQRGPGHTDGSTRRPGSDGEFQTAHGGHQSSSSSGGLFRGIPRISATFFWTSMIASAWWSRRCSLRFSFSSWATRSSRGLRVLLRPRLRASCSSAPWSRSRRHAVRSDEYKPCRRSRAPIDPGSVHRSASWSTSNLNAAVNRRRWALVATCGSGTSGPSVARRSVVEAPPLRAASLRSPALRSGAPTTEEATARGSAFLNPGYPSALFSNYDQGRCLTDVGTEGGDFYGRPL